MIELAGYLATALAIVQLVPQVARTARTRDLDGVSATMWGMLAGQVVAWLLYSGRTGLVPSVLTNVVMGTCVVVMLSLLVADRAPGARRAVRLGIGLGAIAALLGLALPVGVVGAYAAALSMVSMAPQAKVALRSDDLSGLSRPSWVMAVASGSCWIVYGLGHGAPPVYLSALVATSMAAVVLVRLLTTERALATADA